MLFFISWGVDRERGSKFLINCKLCNITSLLCIAYYNANASLYNELQNFPVSFPKWIAISSTFSVQWEANCRADLFSSYFSGHLHSISWINTSIKNMLGGCFVSIPKVLFSEFLETEIGFKTCLMNIIKFFLFEIGWLKSSESFFLFFFSILVDFWRFLLNSKCWS